MADELDPKQMELGELTTSPDDKPIVLREEMEALGLIGPHIKAKELVDETFIIFGAKRFVTRKFPDSPAYFCHCRDVEGSETFTTTLGGVTVVDLLEKYIAAQVNKPFKITLRWLEEGDYEGYYVIE